MQLSYNVIGAYHVFFDAENPMLIRRPSGDNNVKVTLNDLVIEYSAVKQGAAKLGTVAREEDGSAKIIWHESMSVDETLKYVQADSALTNAIKDETGITLTTKIGEWYTRNYSELEQHLAETLTRLFEFYFPTLTYVGSKSIIQEILEVHPMHEKTLSKFKATLLNGVNKPLETWKYSFVTDNSGIVRRYVTLGEILPDRQLKDGDTVLEIAKAMCPTKGIVIGGLSLYKYSEPK